MIRFSKLAFFTTVFSLLMSITLPLAAQLQPEPPRIIMYDLQNRSNDRTKEYFSVIIPANVSIELGQQGKNTVERPGTVIEPQALSSADYDSYISQLQKEARQQHADFIITGAFNTRQNAIDLEIQLYVARLNRIVTISASRQNVGAIINDLIEELSRKIASEVVQWHRKPLPLPAPDKAPGTHDYAIDLVFSIPDASPVFYYTLDGSTPDEKTGTRLEEPLTIDDDTTIKVRAYQPGWDPSPVFSGDYSIKNYIPWFTLTFYYGYPDYVGTFNNYFLAENTGMATATLSIELANLGFIRRTPFIRNFALFGVADALYAEDTKQDSTSTTDSDPHSCYNMYNAAGGLQYIWRMSRIASLSLYAAAGYAKVYGIAPEDSDGFMTLNDRGDGNFSMGAKSVLCGGHLNIFLGPVVLSGGISYYTFRFDETMKAVVYQAGAGLRL